MPVKKTLDEILTKFSDAQRELEKEIEGLLQESRIKFHYHLLQGKVVFEKGIKQFQKQQRTAWWQYIRQAPLSYILSAPIIYAMIIPLFILDLSITLYQHICFRIYDIPIVSRDDFIVIDRHHLAYLNIIEKINCVYCGYGNGLIAYAREITARTEQFWCPIKHAQRKKGAHSRANNFFDYGDAESWQKGKEKLRQKWE